MSTSVSPPTNPPTMTAIVKEVLAQPLVRVKLIFMTSALVSLLMSVTLYFNGHEQQGIYVGIWVPSILSLGSLLVAGSGGGSR